ncbi:MAG: Stp1/IreP family PP2C-type Ser/Thr phosphatase [Clostridia bacterium]|nr:Stp1/IreP family PP2C-type Ser/Thr phosphatase [Clostridia bacterium]MBR2877798.1 Stp1/IreP family PP2C-type Ser/Thr phosphatase [Clostridia bacterium]
MEAFGYSMTGTKHSVNQDSFYIDEARGIFIVADGMGGHAAGDVASSSAINAISSNIGEINVSSIKNALDIANKEVFEKSKTSPTLEGMGTTIAMCCLNGNYATIANIGDSRVHIIKNNEISFVTRDHSFVQQMIDDGQLEASEAKKHSMKNIITRALGVAETVTPDFDGITVDVGDAIMICSDGVSNMLDDEVIVHTVLQSSAEDAAKTLCKSALDAGGKDDLTAIVIKL